MLCCRSKDVETSYDASMRNLDGEDKWLTLAATYCLYSVVLCWYRMRTVFKRDSCLLSDVVKRVSFRCCYQRWEIRTRACGSRICVYDRVTR